MEWGTATEHPLHQRANEGARVAKLERWRTRGLGCPNTFPKEPCPGSLHCIGSGVHRAVIEMAKYVLRACVVLSFVLMLSMCSDQSGNSQLPTPKDLSQPPDLLALVAMPGFSTHPSWSPNGTEIAFVYSTKVYEEPESLYRVSFPAGVPVMVLQVEEGTALRNGGWDPLGEWIALGILYNTSTGGIYIVRPSGENLTRLSEEWATPIWSPDGESLAFDWNGIYVMDRDGASKTQLLPISEFSEICPYLSWSPDSTKLLCASPRSGNWDVYAINADGSGETRLTRSMFRDLTPSWSPDGSRIAFASDRSVPRDIYVMNADGSGVVNITQNGGNEYSKDPDWSPTGQQISFGGGWGTLEVVNADGSDRRTLVATTDCRIGERDWSPDGKWIVFSCAYYGGGDGGSGDLPMAHASWLYVIRVNP